MNRPEASIRFGTHSDPLLYQTHISVWCACGCGASKMYAVDFRERPDSATYYRMADEVAAMHYASIATDSERGAALLCDMADEALA